MKHRRRTNPPLKQSEAAALRAILARHGYRVNARPGTKAKLAKRNPKKKRKTTWRSRWSSRAEMEEYMAKIRKKSVKATKKKTTKKPAKRRVPKSRNPKRKVAKRRAIKIPQRRKGLKEYLINFRNGGFNYVYATSQAGAELAADLKFRQYGIESVHIASANDKYMMRHYNPKRSTGKRRVTKRKTAKRSTPKRKTAKRRTVKRRVVKRKTVKRRYYR